MNLKQDVENLLKHHIDSQGRVTVFPAKDCDPNKGKYDGLNQHLFTGAACLLLLWHKFENEAQELAQNYIANTNIWLHEGVLSRHCSPYWTLPFESSEAKKMGFSHPYDPISLDEYIGYFFAVSVLKQIEGRIYEHSKKVYYTAKNLSWRVYDREPNNSFSKMKLIPELAKLIKLAVKTGDYGGSNNMDQYIYSTEALKYFSRTLQPKDIFIIKKAMGVKPSFLERQHFYISTNFSVRKDKNSGNMLAGYKALFCHFEKLPYRKEWVEAAKKSAFAYFDNKKFPLINIINCV